MSRIDSRPLYASLVSDADVVTPSNMRRGSGSLNGDTHADDTPDAATDNADVTTNDGGDDDGMIFRTYTIRWLVLFVFSLLTITNAIVWIAFAPIQPLAAGHLTHTHRKQTVTPLPF